MGKLVRDDGWRLPDELWERMEPWLPERPAHPLGCHNPRVPDRSAMDAIFFVLRTGSQWQALRAPGICSPSSAYRRFREWAEAGVFEEFWRQGLLAYDALVGIDWSWMAVDGAMSKAPLGGEKSWSQPDRPRQAGDLPAGDAKRLAVLADRWPRSPPRPRGRWRQRGRLQAARADP